MKPTAYYNYRKKNYIKRNYREIIEIIEYWIERIELFNKNYPRYNAYKNDNRFISLWNKKEIEYYL